MAERDGHNVVIQPESATGSAPFVDVATNHTTSLNAADGTPSLSSTTNSSNAQDGLVKTNDLTSSQSHSSRLAPRFEAGPRAGTVSSAGADIAGLKSIREQDNNTPDESAYLDVSADASGASDNETGRADSADLAKDGAQHHRTNSVKRPATFSKVSVTKNFLAKSATAVPTTIKVGEKTAPVAMVTPAALKPRLVAKSASSLSNALKARIGAEGSPGPDASTVWNKNRPAPAMPAKQFTDEELKQQYGIHLATRLQTDENGMGSKWADIDDDEDDWAPDAVVWMDGTKSTLTPAESAAVPPVQKPATPVPPKAADAPKPSLTAMKKTSESSGAIKTILKPGAAAQAKQQTDQSTASPLAEKQALKIKSPAPVPAKSPWATLPPVDRISPVNPPVQVQTHQPLPFASQDARNSDMGPPNGYQGREIAADTFDRSWREGEGERRELFNSSSGKYEPAPAGRRNSVKHDAHARRPAVMHRASQIDSENRPNGTEGSYFPHRRGSSVSHGSALSARRMSYSRGSDSVVSDPHIGNTPGNESRPAPIGQLTPWTQQLPPPPPAGEEAEDPVKVQERVMREKREAARQRRKEEEASEEAAKQERLKAKLNALANAGQSRKERQAAVEKQTAQPIETLPAAEETTKSEVAVEPEIAASKAVPTSSDELLAQDPKDSGELASPSLPEVAQSDSSPRIPQHEHVSPSTVSRSTFPSQNSGSYRTTQTSAFSSPGDSGRKLQPFGRPAAVNHDAFSPWPSASSTNNVWGVSGIGNGTFEGSALFAPMPSAQQLGSLPPPPGMGRPATSSRISPQNIGQASHPPSLQDGQLTDQSLPLTAAIGQPRVNGGPSQSMGRQKHVPGPIGPPSRAQQQQQPPISGRNEGPSSWQSAAQRLPNQYNVDAEDAHAEAAPAEQRRTDVFKETFRQTTGTQNRLGGPRNYGKTEYTIHDAHGSRNISSFANPVPPNAQTQPPAADATSLNSWKPSAENAVRLPDGSQNPAHGGRALQQPPIAPPSHAATSQSVRQPHYLTAPLAPAPAPNNDSPPPPETSSHPVFDGFAHHPHVRLPLPPPVVKLPPTTASATSPNMSPPGLIPQRPLQNWGPVGANQPLVKNGEWQARFNGLFNRTPIQTEIPPSPPRTPPKAFAPVLAVASSSRIFLDDTKLISNATVSLPRSAKSTSIFVVDGSNSTTSKETVQHMFNEELGFGSRPRVRIPRAHYRHVQPGKAVDGDIQDIIMIDVQSKPDLPIFHLFYKKPDGFYIKMPGSLKNKLVLQDRKPSRFPGKINKSRVVSTRKAPDTAADAPGSAAHSVRKTSSPRNVHESGKHSSSPPTFGTRKRSGMHKHALKPVSATAPPVKSK